MVNKNDEVLTKMQLALARELLKRVESGEATAAELNVARQMLKDNDFQAPPDTNPALDKMKQAMNLPSFPDEEALPA